MQTSAATRAPCAHCGLPVSAVAGAPDAVYCCHACRVVALIIGKQQGEQGRNLLRLGFGTLLAMNIMMISLMLYAGNIEAQTVPVFRLVLLGLAIPALAILLPPFLVGALRECSARKVSLDALIACGSLAAFCVSAVNAARGSGAVYFDTATMLPVLVTFGKIIESCAKTRAADLMHSLESLLPDTAQRVTPAGSEEVAVAALRPGDLVRVRPGERIAVDGRIREGSSCIEEAAFTGEFLPRLCSPGDDVLAGTINGTGSLVVQAQRTGSELLLHGMVAMINDAWRNQSRAERIAERAATLFIPVLLMLAAVTLVCWSLLGDLGQGLLNALSVLVVACPCTMGIATPLATSLAIGRAARAGIVVRGGCVMEQMARTDLVFFDKTGTITEGRPVLQEIQVSDDTVEPDELLGRLAVLESAGGHVLGRAIAAEASRRGCGAGTAARVQVTPGLGMSGAVTWRGETCQVLAGTASFVAAASAAGPETASPAGDGDCSVIEVAWDGRLRGRLLFSDAIRPKARECVEALAEQGISSVLLSGDRLPAAACAARQTGIAQVEAPRSPAQKLQAIIGSVAAGNCVAMVGDGINDAPALAAAHTGIAFCAGTDLPRQAGNVVILSGSLMQVPWLIGLSRQTANIIRRNFAWSFGYNAVALAAASLGLLHPLLAALAMVASSLTVLGNSLRISGYPHEDGRTRRQAPGAARHQAAAQAPSECTAQVNR